MSQTSRRQFLALSAAPGLLPAFSWAQSPASPTWPTRPVRLLVAYPPGGVSDVVARLLAERLQGPLGQPVVIENKAGASGAIAMDAVAKSAPDGYTLGFSAISPLTLSPHLGKLPYDPAHDLVPVVNVMASPVLLLATPGSGLADFAGLLAQARKLPGQVRWATAGQASLGHIMLEQLRAAAQVDITHVPYKGGGQQMTDALSGQFEVLSTNASAAVLQHVKSGRLQPLAVGAASRLEALPKVPTLAELGYPAANLASQFGLLAPARTPAAVVERINAEVNRVLAQPDVRSRLLASENLPVGGKASDFARLIAQESEANARIIRQAGIKAE
ncbi:MAG: tripartite tricarboxylate transporter substrate binding protein [Curvibacter lanceolatus]|jgi:tripartite-type tricarboxylate transporter receptor subunit TctC|uniref:Bug family tripartite tricarboxylate transporter substrate binding protein n=1 Tax=Curvibacter lanceolatus TaxID=86182 RepID=UPI0023541A2E|nr:tripartite tricarboxylate transporter substrate binding protein [Curvibacter lanceolatus]MBV5291023.1 tripartite tricarboxylate transporter substrate binding protein [Curvibacter lanceolatus]